MKLLSEIQPCDIIMVHKLPPYSIQSIPAPVIRFLTNCYYNHCAIIGEALGELYVFEAVGRGFIPTHRWSDYIHTIGVDKEIAIMRDIDMIYTKEDIYENIDDLVGRGYDFKGTLWYQLWYQLTGRWTGPTGEGAKQLVYCSEAIAEGFKHRFPYPYKTSPANIYNCKQISILWESRFDK